MIKPTYLLTDEFTRFEHVFHASSFVRKRITKGSIIYHPEQKRDYSYYILEGIAVFYLCHECGRDKITTFRGNGTIFPLYCEENQYSMEAHIGVKAVTDMTVLVIPKKQLKNLMLCIPELSLAMTQAYCKYCSVLLYDMENQLFENYTCRTCNFLYVYTKYMKKLCVKLSHEDIAQATGITRSNVSRVISKLKKENILRCVKNGFEIVDEESLLAMCSTDFAP